jgi:hypothetical protein
MRDARRLDHLNLFQPRSGVAQVVEQARPGSEEDRDEGDQHLVEQSCRQVLLDGGGPAAEGDVLAGGGLLGLLERGVDATVTK